MKLQQTGPGNLSVASRSVSVAQRNRVLRNTYWLLALSMVPTVLGAWVGIGTGIASALTPGIGLIVFLGSAFAFMFAIEKTKNSAAGVPILLAFTFFMGMMLSRLVGAVLGLSNGASLVMMAFAGTARSFSAWQRCPRSSSATCLRWASGCSSVPSCCSSPASPTSSFSRAS